ncbi:putative phosphate starvation-inducible protein [Aeromonas phage LAh_9]|uniref:PhoH-like protein n=4 Tax=Lahexavirus TaxID=2843411 RepID=A0A5B9N8T3_9CAUD|nr:PhoH-like phosphate starvation-inducible [Aeromonas phage 4_4572]YP_009847260.1 PhoH-like phosphate starvation-inducible [Aeromonas phage LAh_6]YP_009847468.1 PhoH-like phosphate starvation-inducible [Aeromonas phage LAh_8]YP_009847564.1 PhoH-like phosphate starvation-inducible [Aeromonas phage LAh_9]QDH46514.1 putative phosphate starvation-inducible protein [Aeromonas phage LAh_6]QDH46749.1 putative phosphate starvation-inducible protein [Aeromonas phage LAh_8]QDH46894.1 putative phosphat
MRKSRKSARNFRPQARRQMMDAPEMERFVQSQSDEQFEELKVKPDKSRIEPKNISQARYIHALHHKPLVFATGEAGCGKTFLSTVYACERLLAKDVERIIVTRPVLSADEDLGYLPGDMSEKFAPYFRPVYDVLLKRLGSTYLEYCLKPRVAKVEIAPFAYMRGRTFENAVIILDEAQNVTPQQMKMFLTRLGENVTVIVNGDITQCDLPKEVPSGLEDALERFRNDKYTSIIEFGIEDCVRSELCQHALRAYND